MWQLQAESNGKRLYKNSETGSECSQTMCYTDKDGNKWWSFDDLILIPFVRTFAATKVSSLYALGLTKDDLTGFVSKHKATLKSNDSEKYEKAYAELLDFEGKANQATDPVKQMSALVPVYFTMNDEPIDSFENNLQLRKMSLLEADIEMHSFFLRRQIDATENYMSILNKISKIVSLPPKEPPEVSD